MTYRTSEMFLLRKMRRSFPVLGAIMAAVALVLTAATPSSAFEPTAQLRTQSINDFEHFPVNTTEPVLPIGDSVEQYAQRMNSSAGVCACSIDVFSRRATSGPIGQTSFKDLNGQRFAVSVVAFDYALKLLKAMAKTFDDTESLDGCYARAHRISYQLEKDGVLTGKVTALGRFRLRDKRAARGATSWRYHMAPIVAINDGSTISAWVLDPALFNEPVPLNAWLALLIQQKGSVLKQAYLSSRFVYHPSKASKARDDWDPADLIDANRTIRNFARSQRLSQNPGLWRLELSGLEISPLGDDDHSTVIVDLKKRPKNMGRQRQQQLNQQGQLRQQIKTSDI